MPVQTAIACVYMRGGTSRALVFHARDLPPLADSSDRSAWDAVFLAALGSPDPAGRQLDGLGGGISSLSKVAVVAPSQRADADVDFTFGQVSVRGTTVGYVGNCGNISSAIGPFAIDEGLVRCEGDWAEVRIFNTNTGKIIRSRFALVDGQAAVRGDFELQGVAGRAAPIRLDFLDPGGAVTGKLLPSGAVRDTLDVAGLGEVQASLVDAANPVVFVDAASVGLSGRELPDAMARDTGLLARLDALRIAASLRMGVAASEAEARTTSSNLPLVGMVSAGAAEADLTIRMISAGQPHKAIPLTGAMCVAVAARIAGTIVSDAAGPAAQGDADLRIAHPTGVLTVAASVTGTGAGARAEFATVYRTARRLMEGKVLVPSDVVLGGRARGPRAP